MFNKQSQFNKIEIDLSAIKDKDIVNALNIILNSINQDKEKLNIELQNIERFAYKISSGKYSYEYPKIEKVVGSLKTSFAKSLAAISSSIIEIHNQLNGREALDCHPITSITNLRNELDSIWEFINQLYSVIGYTDYRCGYADITTSGEYTINFDEVLSNRYLVIAYTINQDEISFPEILYNTATKNNIKINTYIGKLYWFIFPFQSNFYTTYYSGAANVGNGIYKIRFKNVDSINYNVFAYVVNDGEIYFPTVLYETATTESIDIITTSGSLYWILLIHNSSFGSKYRAGLINVNTPGQIKIQFDSLQTNNYNCLIYTINNGIINFPEVLYETATNNSIDVKSDIGDLRWNIFVR